MRQLGCGMSRQSRVMAAALGASMSWQAPTGAPVAGPPPAIVAGDSAGTAGVGSIRLISGTATSLAEVEDGDEDTLNSANGDDGNLAAGAPFSTSQDAAPASNVAKAPIDDASCGPTDDIDTDDEDMVPMIDDKTGEWGGPTRGGSMPEPTRFGDWERKGRCTDFS